MSNAFTPLRRTAQSLGLITVGALSTLGALSLTHVGPAQAKSPGVSMASLTARLSADEATIAALKAKTAPLSVSGRDLTITGVNVHIIDGTGRTINTSGLGNLIIGYNGSRGVDSKTGDSLDVRTGCHNLILGNENNYSSFGGLVVGQHNTISGPYASVSGGISNTASNSYASVSGGLENTASGTYSSVSGGLDNKANGVKASVSGGSTNTASGASAWVSGGVDNRASDDYASVSGGRGNTASGEKASVSGGSGNWASSESSSVSGGGGQQG